MTQLHPLTPASQSCGPWWSSWLSDLLCVRGPLKGPKTTSPSRAVKASSIAFDHPNSPLEVRIIFWFLSPCHVVTLVESPNCFSVYTFRVWLDPFLSWDAIHMHTYTSLQSFIPEELHSLGKCRPLGFLVGRYKPAVAHQV